MKKKGSKGFTLIELLAVIVILAIIIIIVSVNIMSILNTSKENSFKIYAERILTKSQEALLEDSMSDISVPGTFDLDDFGFKDTGKYTGCIYVGTDNKPKLYLTDDYYSYVNVSFEDIEGNHSNTIKKTSESVNSVKSQCSSS